MTGLYSSRRPDPAHVQVICLGLGRTGTSSLREALAVLGFGPCYHMSVIMHEGGDDFPMWYKIGDGNGTAKDFDGMFGNYKSVISYPACLYPAELYASYPDAKFILTTRNPASWAKSMHGTILRVNDMLESRDDKASLGITHWNDKYLYPYHHGKLHDDPQQELHLHNERVKSIIPAEKLLMYEVTDGWGKLVKFLGVPQPSEPFPRVNDTAEFHQWVMSQ